VQKPHYAQQITSARLIVLLKRRVTESGSEACAYTDLFW
jgi:hypothetical protein